MRQARSASLFGMLFYLTMLFIFAQLAFFYAHYKVSDLIDAFTQSAIARDLLHPIILFPLLKFMALQGVAYLFFIVFIWFIATSAGECLALSKRATYWLGIGCWVAWVLVILSLNDYCFPASFFARPFSAYELIAASSLLMGVTATAYINVVWFRRHVCLGGLFLLIGGGALAFFVYTLLPATSPSSGHSRPHLIVIGLDSLRPDFTGFQGNRAVHTPNIDQFLKTATTFTQAYTPLARTYPAWMSILTGQYPKHHEARINLIDPAPVLANEMLSKQLQAQGYYTIYGTDEARFTDINSDYGFDRILGPKGGAVEFLLGGLSDFPLTNLLINLPIGRYLFPYNYGNRAADITYHPSAFLQWVKSGLVNRPDKPVFLALHLCLSHWPFTWAEAGQAASQPLSRLYQNSVEAVDAQLGELFDILKQAGLLQHSLVVLLSDHGVTVGLPDDRAIHKDRYRGDPRRLTALPVYPLGSTENQYSLNTSYGQGTDVLSLKQYHVLLSFKGFGLAIPSQQVNARTSLLDIAPTLLDFLQMAPLKKADGVSLFPYLSGLGGKTPHSAPFFMETADTIADMEADKVFVEKVIQQKIGAYRVNVTNGQLVLIKEALPPIIKSKQRAVLWGDFMLASYPPRMRMIFAPIPGDKQHRLRLKPDLAPGYFVLLNLKTGLWTVGLTSAFAEDAPTQTLLRALKSFYGDEV